MRPRRDTLDATASHDRPAAIRGAASGALAFVTVGLVSGVDGGYFPTAWGVIALSLLFVAAAVLILADRVELGALELVWLLASALLVGWVALSAAWSDSLPRTVLEVQRDLVYLAALCALLALACRKCASSILTGLLGAIAVVTGYALATRLLPDVLGYDGSDPYRLARPLGYWNSLGIFASMGVVLAAGFAGHAATRTLRALGAALLPVLFTALALTYSRGAWIALAAGALCAIAFSPQRLRLAVTLVALAPPSAVAVWLAFRADGLATRAPFDLTVDAGRRFLALLVLLAAASAAMSVLAERAAGRIRVGQRARRAVGVAAAVATVVAILLAVRNPGSLLGRVTEAFRAPAPAAGEGLGERLLSFSGNGRSEYWSIAWSQYTSHPLLGSGGGTYEIYWTRDRPNAFGARDAHNLYLETLAELGPVGLLLLAALLATPLVAFAVGRRSALAAAGAGSYVAYLVHAGIDWDWEVPAVTLAALFIGAGVVIAARSERSWTLPRAGRIAVLAVIGALGTFAFVTAVGNGALAASERAAAAGEAAEAEAAARKSTRWAPWSAEAWLAVAQAQLVQGQRTQARASVENGIERDRADWRLWSALAGVTEGAARDAALAEATRLNPMRKP